MAGYTRQSSASITPGAVIRAAHANNEFNALEAAFDGTTGHKHDGTAGNGPTLPPTCFSGLTSNGLVMRVSSSSFATRTFAGTANQITVTNGDGVSGNPTLSLPSTLTCPGTVSATGFTGPLTGNASTATKLQTARTINGVAFDGTADISIATVSGNAATASALATPRLINGTAFDGTANITITAVNPSTLTLGSYLTGTAYNGSGAVTAAVNATASNSASTVVARDSLGNFSAGTITAALTGNASTATKLQTVRTINGINFDGSANITINATDSTARLALTGGTLSGTLTGTTFLAGAGTVGAPSVSFSGDTNTGMYLGATDELRFATNGTDRLKILSNGDVGIGGTTTTSADSRYFTVKGPASGLGYGSVRVEGGTTTKQGLLQCSGANGDVQIGADVISNTTGAVSLYSGGFQRTTLTADGAFRIGQNTTSTPGYSTDGTVIGISMNLVGNTGRVFVSQDNFSQWNMTSDGVLMVFSRSGTSVGSIGVTTTSTSYGTTSDYRLKQDVVPLTGALTRLADLKPSRFAFKAEPGTVVDGFIAHEVAEVVPQAVIGTKDQTDLGGNPVYQSMDASKLIPLLVASIQELTARVEALEAAAS